MCPESSMYSTLAVLKIDMSHTIPEQYDLLLHNAEIKGNDVEV